MDLVFPYVNNSDKEWQDQYYEFCKKSGYNPGEAGNTRYRFRDIGTLKYLFRGIDKYMPFVDNVFLLVQSESQVPKWLNRDKVKVVLHEQFIPKEFLPTYNSMTIETFLWNVPGLGEEFIYANDDMFPTNMLSIEDFFTKNNTPKFHLVEVADAKKTFFQKLLSYIWNLAKKGKTTNVKNGRIMRPQHCMYPILKSVAEKAFKEHKEEILKNVTHFRSHHNINPYLYLYYQELLGLRKPHYLDFRYYEVTDKITEMDIAKAIVFRNHKMICINDTFRLRNPQVIVDGFKKAFPEKSRFEK